MRPYLVRQGDYMTKLALRFGFDALAVWASPRNRALREKRRSPELLAPGDIVYLPDSRREGLPLQSAVTNRYRARVPTVRLRVALRTPAEALANEPFVVEGLHGPLLALGGGAQKPALGRCSIRYEGASDGEGVATFEVPITIDRVWLSLPGRGLRIQVRPGHLDPENEPSGLRQRLVHLGFLSPGVEQLTEEERSALIADALLRFQRSRGLQPTGLADDATVNELRRAHGT